ncbi:MAG TPA: arginine--tRNA ligase [Syntrophobacteraceae bacterium]|nr:arginine--tRNA ligase [Syntrophobacteraceae bacterium]
MGIVRKRVEETLSRAVARVLDSPTLPDSLSIELDIPKFSQHGHYASNAALSLSRILKRPPREIASRIIENLESDPGMIRKVEIAGPGFINFFIQPAAWLPILSQIHREGKTYGTQTVGKGRKVQVEFVSANPTGPLHIGHGRGAAIGDVLANILEVCGYEVQREYYINDAGNQMNTLGSSLYYRYRELLGKEVAFPEGHYQGDYMRDLARDFLEKEGEKYRDSAMDEVLPVFARFAGDRILEGIRQDLASFGVTFQEWFSEQTLHDRGEILGTIEALEKLGFVYEAEGAKWFRSTAFGDEKDRVVVRANGISTYFAADLAYHKNKFERGFHMVVDIWGADHHGYVDRMSAGVQALGRDRADLRIILVQLVNLLRGGKPVAMSTRAGEFVTLREVIDEVGKDAARFIFLTRRTDSPLDFDLDVAKMQTNDNPVFYVQYAHARLSSLFEVAGQRGISCRWAEGGEEPPLHRLTVPQELEILQQLGEYPQVLLNCVKSLEPHYIPYYLHELVSLFHSYYNRNRILGDDPELTQARLYLASALRRVIGNALGVLGVAAPEKM